MADVSDIFGEAGQQEQKQKQDEKRKKEKEKNAKKIKWLSVIWKLFGEESFLVVLKKEYYKEVKKAYPGKVLYFLPEIRQLARSCAGNVKTLRKVHAVKKILGGWVMPEVG